MKSSSRSMLVLVVMIAAAGLAYVVFTHKAIAPPAPHVAQDRIDAVGPTLVSNQTSYPLTIYGSGFVPGDQVVLQGAFNVTLPATVIDGAHLATRLPPQKIAPTVDSVVERVTVQHPDGGRISPDATLTVVNDGAFEEPYACALTPDGAQLFVASPTTDELFRYDTASGKRETLATGDGPRALAITADGKQLVLADELASALEVRALDSNAPPRMIALDGWPQELALDGQTAWVTTRQGGLLRVDLTTGNAERDRVPGKQPRALALVKDRDLYVAQLGTDDVTHLRPIPPQAGMAPHPAVRIAPGPGVKIVGGRTERYGAFVMGGKAARALAYDPVHELLFASTIGPNIGPNPDRVEVSMNGGVEVIDARKDEVRHHVGLGAGVLEGLAIDPARNRLYAADLALGRILAFDTAKLATDPAHALLGELKILPPPATPHIRADADFDTNLRAGLEIHSGPRALCLDARRELLYAVNRLSGTVSVVDVKAPQPKLARTFEGPEMWNQRERRLGDILYFTDLGRSGMSCDACHLEGHTSGILYEKTHPLRIYRVPTLRGIRDSAPYFTPSALPTLKVVAHDVLGRNRFHNPEPTQPEIDALADYQALITVRPNPNVEPSGALRRELTLPDGQVGDAVHGMELFESPLVGCSARLCHPRPTFSADQDPTTRNHFEDVGTPVIIGLHPEWQEQVWKGWPPPPLAGTWDVFPLLESGAGGLGTMGDAVVPTSAFPHRALLEQKAGARPHGNTAQLTGQDKNDLLAYLMSL